MKLSQIRKLQRSVHRSLVLKHTLELCRLRKALLEAEQKASSTFGSDRYEREIPQIKRLMEKSIAMIY